MKDFMAEENEVKQKDGRSQVFQAAGLVAVLVLLSRIVGLGREIVTRSLLGTQGLDATAYEVA